MTGIGLKTTQFFSFQKISTNMVARGVPSFGQNGPRLAGWLSNGSLVDKRGQKNTLLSAKGTTSVSNFQLFGHYSNKNQDIFLKFSAFLYLMFVLNWQKNFGRCSISLPATTNFDQNFGWLLWPYLLEFFFWKKFLLGSRPIPVAIWKEFWISWKKWCF